MNDDVWTPHKPLNSGDIVTMRRDIYRKWWQFWKPRVVGSETARYRVIEGPSSSDPVSPHSGIVGEE